MSLINQTHSDPHSSLPNDGVILNDLRLSLEDEFKSKKEHLDSKIDEVPSKNDQSSKKIKKYESQRPQFVIGKRKKKNSVYNEDDSLKSQQRSQKQNYELSKSKMVSLEKEIKKNTSTPEQLSQIYKLTSGEIRRCISDVKIYGRITEDHDASSIKLSAKSRVFEPFVRDLIIKQPFLNQTEIKNMIEEELDVTLSQQTVSKILDALGYSKKRRINTNIQGDTEENKLLRQQYAKIYQNELNQRQLLFIDEIGISEIIQREFGYSPIGQPLIRSKRSLKKQVVTLSIVMGYEKLHDWTCIEGPPQPTHLASMLQKLGDEFAEWFLVLDNAKIHKSFEIRQASSRKRIRILYLPPNSPELNPAQLLFAQLKNVYRSLKLPQITNIQQMIMRVNECCKKLQNERFWTYKAQIIHWIEKALEKKNFFYID